MSQASSLASSVPSVSLHNGRPATTSREIASYFGKRHDDVIKSIRNLQSNCPEAFNARNFAEVEYEDDKGENRPMFILYRDGFMLLVMGYTGKKALGIKLAYIEAFNRMEDMLRENQRRPLADELLLPPLPPEDEADDALPLHIFAAIDAAERCASSAGQPVSVPLLPPRPEAEGGRAHVREMERLPGGLLRLHLTAVRGAVPPALVLDAVVAAACGIRTGDTLRFSADARFLSVDASARPLSALPFSLAGEVRHG